MVDSFRNWSVLFDWNNGDWLKGTLISQGEKQATGEFEENDKGCWGGNSKEPYGLLGKSVIDDSDKGNFVRNCWNGKNGKENEFGIIVGGENNGIELEGGINDTTWFAWRHVEKHEGIHCAGQFGNIFWIHCDVQFGMHESTHFKFGNFKS